MYTIILAIVLIIAFVFISGDILSYLKVFNKEYHQRLDDFVRDPEPGQGWVVSGELHSIIFVNDDGSVVLQRDSDNYYEEFSEEQWSVAVIDGEIKYTGETNESSRTMD